MAIAPGPPLPAGPPPPIRLPVPPPGSTPGYLRFPLLVSGGFAALDAGGRARALGAAASYPGTLAELAPVRARLAGPPGPWPGAETLARELVTVPTGSLLTGADARELLRLLYSAARGGRA